MEDQQFKCLDGIKRATNFSKNIDQKFFDLSLKTKITHGHGVASRASEKYSDGTIALQYPHFKKLGLDLSVCYPGTLNLSIAPKRYKIIKPRYYFKEVDWYPARKQTENFMLADCYIKSEHGFLPAYIYQPDPSTKIEHFDDPMAFQIISAFLPGVTESSELEIFISSQQIQLI